MERSSRSRLGSWLLAGAHCALLLGLPAALAAQDSGHLAGVVRTPDGRRLGGVEVRVEPLGRSAVTDAQGSFEVGTVAAGPYTLTLRLGDLAAPSVEVVVAAGETEIVDLVWEGDFHFAETIYVESASRRRERLVDAPAAMTKLDAERIELENGLGEVPGLLGGTPGAEPTQSGLFAYNLNTRGLNAFLSRRIQVLVDGRDPSIPATSSQEWWLLALLQHDLESVELLRGPSAALYGPNSVNGVLNLTTKAPRESQGGRASLSTGELSLLSGNLRWAGGVGGGTYFKLLGHYTESDTFSRSRNEKLEYPGLPPEVLPVRPGGIDFNSAAVRLDKDFADGGRLTFEVGRADGEGLVHVTSVGRFQELDIRQSWGRVNYNAARWNAAATFNQRRGDHLFLASAAPLLNDDSNFKLELQANQVFADGRLRLVGGLSYGEESLDSADANGLQTLYFAPIEESEQAAFAQLDATLADNLKLVVAARWDDSSLYDAQFSPKVSLVYQPSPAHSLRVGYNQAFEVGSYTEYFLSVPAAPPADLSVIEDALAPLLGGVRLGLDFVPVFAFGNEQLDVEKIRSVELGYRGILGRRSLLSIDTYQSRMRNFLSPLLPGINPAFPPYRAPAALPPPIAAAVEGVLNSAVPGLGNAPDGAPWIVVSFANTGEATTRGVEVALSHQPHRRWLLDASYSWFDLTVEAEIPGAEIQPNAPEHKAGLNVTYRQDPMAVSLGYRWVDRFDWVAGLFMGPVPSYQVADLHLRYDLSARWQLGVDVANLLDESHYEVFGGDLLRRRAAVRLATSW